MKLVNVGHSCQFLKKCQRHQNYKKYQQLPKRRFFSFLSKLIIFFRNVHSFLASYKQTKCGVILKNSIFWCNIFNSSVCGGGSTYMISLTKRYTLLATINNDLKLFIDFVDLIRGVLFSLQTCQSAETRAGISQASPSSLLANHRSPGAGLIKPPSKYLSY